LWAADQAFPMAACFASMRGRRKLSPADVNVHLRILTGQLRDRITREAQQLRIAEHATFRAIRSEQLPQIQQGTQNFLIASRRIAALEAARSAVEELSIRIDQFSPDGRSPDFMSWIKTLVVVGREFRLQVFDDFKANLLSKVFTPREILEVGSSEGLDEAVRQSLYDKSFSDAECDQALETIAAACGLEPDAVAQYMKVKPPEAVRYPALDHIDVASPPVKVRIPINLPAFPRERWAALLSAVDFAAGSQG
jgi:hypothetical protein